MQQAGLKIADIPQLKRQPADYLGFVEVHIEQGPVLNELDIPLGVVTSINGSVRFVGEVTGMASHAGTTPMDRRRDAANAVAELALYVEKRALQDAETCVGTVGQLHVPNGSINVVPGRCQFSLDLRATTNAARDALMQDVLAELQAICERRGLSLHARRNYARKCRTQRPCVANPLGKCRAIARCTCVPSSKWRRRMTQ
jgi:N-carbamoyl-L-amino-acid hydrolase